MPDSSVTTTPDRRPIGERLSASPPLKVHECVMRLAARERPVRASLVHRSRIARVTFDRRGTVIDESQPVIPAPVEQGHRATSPVVRFSPALTAAAGLAAGTIIGALARLWMRLIAVGPTEFTWSGTIAIVAVFAMAGLMLGFFIGVQGRGWTGRAMTTARLVGIAAIAPVSLAQGATMAPTMVLGGLALGRRDWRLWVRITLGAGSCAAFIGIQWPAIVAHWRESPDRLAMGLLIGAGVYGSFCAAWARTVAPMPGLPMPRMFSLVVALAILSLAVSAVGTIPAVVAVASVIAITLLVRRRRRRSGAPGEQSRPDGSRTESPPRAR